jgi:hypothetical protein
MYRERTLSLLPALRAGAVALFVTLSFVAFSQKAFAAAPTASAATITAATSTTVTITVTGTDFDQFVSSNTTTANATDLAKITYDSTNPTAAVRTNITTLTLTFPITIGTDKSGGSLTIAANAVQDTSDVNNALITIVTGSITDSAGPVVVSTSIEESAIGTSRNADLVLTFSEPMDPNFAEGTEFSMSPDPGVFSAAFTSSATYGSNAVMTLTIPILLCSTTYTMTTTEAQVVAAAGGVTTMASTGVTDGDFTFRTGTCTSPVSGAQPANISITYNGPSCAMSGGQSFSVTGSNVAEYVVSGDQYFTSSSDWTTLSGSITADLHEDAHTAYLLFRSEDGTMSNAYDVALSDWSAACGSDDEEVIDEDEDEGTVTPVAGVSPGDVVRSSSSSSVYYITENYGRRVFLNSAVYFTWYNSFNNVKEISPETLSALPLEGVMLPKAGVVLVKIASDARVYFLAEGDDMFKPELRAIADESTAKMNFGSNWADYVIDVEPTFFVKFGKGANVSSGEDVHATRLEMKTRAQL